MCKLCNVDNAVLRRTPITDEPMLAFISAMADYTDVPLCANCIKSYRTTLASNLKRGATIGIDTYILNKLQKTYTGAKGPAASRRLYDAERKAAGLDTNSYTTITKVSTGIYKLTNTKSGAVRYRMNTTRKQSKYFNSLELLYKFKEQYNVQTN